MTHRIKHTVIKLTATQWAVTTDGTLNRVVSIHRSKRAAENAAAKACSICKRPTLSESGICDRHTHKAHRSV